MMLSDVCVNETVKIIKLPNDYSYSLRLREMGLGEGEKVKCVLKPLFKSPILFQVKSTLLSIRLCDCKQIEVAYE